MTESNKIREQVGMPVVEGVLKHEKREPEEGIGFCMSGGGFRAMLFHLGGLWRMNEIGLLNRLDRISSVSGGSIVSAVLGMNWGKLDFDSNGTAGNFDELITTPVRSLADQTVDLPSVIGGFLLPGTPTDFLANTLKYQLFGDKTLQDLPDEPRFVINASNLTSGCLWRFSKPYMGDWKIGLVNNPDVPLAKAVAASAAFPPFLSPLVLRLTHEEFDPETRGPHYEELHGHDAVLVDGGVYDNLGLETVWKRYKTVLVSDGGGPFGIEPNTPRNIMHNMRVMMLIWSQIRSLRTRQLISSYQEKDRLGSYWWVATPVEEYNLPDSLECPEERTSELAGTPTRLMKLEPEYQERLINWGYAACDASIRKYYLTDVTAATEFPYGAVGV